MALSDYSALFSKNSDLMFDAIKFGVGIVSDEGFESFKDAKIYYNYAWTYNKKVDNEVNASNDFLNVLVKTFQELMIIFLNTPTKPSILQVMIWVEMKQ